MLVCYFIPTVVASSALTTIGSVIVLNTFLGWALIGWVIAIIWASTVDIRRNHAGFARPRPRVSRTLPPGNRTPTAGGTRDAAPQPCASPS